VIDLRFGDCREVLCSLPAASVDAVITDPPYPEITREYGRWTEAEWHDLMRTVVGECRHILKPHGSAVFILQPNSERVGRMRMWPWEFLLQVGKEWNVVQDVWWFNDCTMPGGGEGNRRGLLRSAVKMCVWAGAADCYRARSAVMIDAAAASFRMDRLEERYSRKSFGCHGLRTGVMRESVLRTGEATPFNLLPYGRELNSSREGHAAGTPQPLMDWWVRYICPEGGVVCDPFMGSGTCGLAALGRNRSFLGIESFPEYFAIAERRIHAALAETPLFA
jgi:DNA modification methylase